MDNLFVCITHPDKPNWMISEFVKSDDEAAKWIKDNSIPGCNCRVYTLNIIANGYNGSDHKTA